MSDDLEKIIARCREKIESRDSEVLAWKALDWDFVGRQIDELAKLPRDARGPLFGLPVGIKDIFDTADLPTGYGSAIYEGHQPGADAAAVARLRAAGAIILGKTVSTEFAYWKAGPTRNPLDLERTPGGSSSGSVAAVADGMVPLAIGSQTAASTIRPAAYCGIVGFKPTWGLISLAGVKALSNSLDTVGIFSKDVAGAGLLSGVLAGRPGLMAPAEPGSSPRLALRTSPEWEKVAPSALDAVKKTADLAARHGADVKADEVPATFAGLADIQTTIMAYEAARELAHERRCHFDRLSQPLRDLLTQGESISSAAYDHACRKRDECLNEIDSLFGDADALLAPSTLGEAPLFEEGTGDPILSRAWTLLGLPSITLPCGIGENGFPLGLQIAARPRQDQHLLAIAAWLEQLLATTQ
ncbi:MAG: amidase [Alphaproteobacteria bacterium]|nr:amidase [Alphaproteobacteria bacterium]MBT7943482.1 amidase [Alphaproteobacteria bacterium]